MTIQHRTQFFVTGTIQPIAELAALTHTAGALFHTDAAQTTGTLPFTVDDLGVDLLSVRCTSSGGRKALVRFISDTA